MTKRTFPRAYPDSRTRRGSICLVDHDLLNIASRDIAGSRWRPAQRFAIPIRRPQRWQSPNNVATSSTRRDSWVCCTCSTFAAGIPKLPWITHERLCLSRREHQPSQPVSSLNRLRRRAMPDHRSDVDGARVLADLNALRAIGAYKSGVHKPTFSQPHMRSLEWLAQRLPEAGLA